MNSIANPISGAAAPEIEALIEQPPARQPLSRATCLALLARGGHGRVATSMRAVPIIIPVSFTLLGSDVVFSTGLGDGLSRAVADCVVAFETDHAGPDGRSLWDVYVTGVARAMSQPPGFRLSSEIITGSHAGDKVSNPEFTVV